MLVRAMRNHGYEHLVAHTSWKHVGELPEGFVLADYRASRKDTGKDLSNTKPICLARVDNGQGVQLACCKGDTKEALDMKIGRRE